jgi:hypothetical protein
VNDDTLVTFTGKHQHGEPFRSVLRLLESAGRRDVAACDKETAR